MRDTPVNTVQDTPDITRFGRRVGVRSSPPTYISPTYAGYISPTYADCGKLCQQNLGHYPTKQTGLPRSAANTQFLIGNRFRWQGGWNDLLNWMFDWQIGALPEVPD